MTGSRSIICTGVGKLEIQSTPKPKLQPGHLLIKTKAVALNPTDWKAVYNPSGFAVGARPGVDFSGVVEEVGPGVTADFKAGDRVCGATHGCKDSENGAFGDHIIAKEHVVIKIPENIDFEQAATLGVGVITCGQALYGLLDLPLPPASPSEPQKALLIGGGSTATAVLGIQYAKLSGIRVIATASPYNFDYLRSLGADVLLDYHENVDELVEKVKAATDGSLTMAWDCSPNEKFQEVAALSMSRAEKGIYATVAPLTPADFLRGKNPMVESKFQIGYTAFGEDIIRGEHVFPKSQEDADSARGFWKLSAKLLEDGKIVPTRATVNQGGKGLEGVLVGFADLHGGKVSGTKLVYSL